MAWTLYTSPINGNVANEPQIAPGTGSVNHMASEWVAAAAEIGRAHV